MAAARVQRLMAVSGEALTSANEFPCFSGASLLRTFRAGACFRKVLEEAGWMAGWLAG